MAGSERPARRTRTEVHIDRERGLFMISVAADLAGMHPQTLRIYESRGLVAPQRSPKGTRLYSQADVDRLRRIAELTSDFGMNLAGVERVFALESELDHMDARMRDLEDASERMRAELAEEVERVRRSFRAELVRYEAPGNALVPRSAGGRAFRIPIRRDHQS